MVTSERFHKVGWVLYAWLLLLGKWFIQRLCTAGWMLWFAYLRPFLAWLYSLPTLEKGRESPWKAGLTGVVAIAVVAVLGMLLWFCTPDPVGAAGPENADAASRASDGQSLTTQSIGVQESFRDVFGIVANINWKDQHEQELMRLSPWTYGWSLQTEGNFVYAAYNKTGGRADIFTPRLHSGYNIGVYRYFGFLDLVNREGATGQKGCESRVDLNIDYRHLVFRQGSCTPASYEYPYLRAGISGERVPVPHQTRPKELPIREPLGLFDPSDPTSEWFYWQLYVDDRSMYLVVEIKTSRRTGEGVPVIQVRIPQGQALELKVPCDACRGGYGHRTLWNDKQGWHFVRNPASPEEGSPFWSLWGTNYLTIEKDGSARYRELPYLHLREAPKG